MAKIPKKDRCTACKGRGWFITLVQGIVTCPDCNGTGRKKES